MNKVESALQRTTDTKALVIGNDALPRSAQMFRELFPGKRAIIVADKVTYPLAGEAVMRYFEAAGIAQDEPHVFGYDDSFAEWSYVEELENVLKQTRRHSLVAVGSGVINDLTKLTAHRCGRPLHMRGHGRLDGRLYGLRRFDHLSGQQADLRLSGSLRAWPSIRRSRPRLPWRCRHRAMPI